MSIDQKLELWYSQPSHADWNSALPIGNGRLGAMVYGNIISERIQLNEDSLWSGGPRDRLNRSCLDQLPRIHQLIEEGSLREAKTLVNDAMAGVPDSMRCYEPLADLMVYSEPKGVDLHYSDEDEACADSYVIPTFDQNELTVYRRSLDLDEAVAAVDYTLAGTRYTRESIASHAAPVIALRWEASEPDGLNLRIRLERGPRQSYSTRYADSTVSIENAGLLMQGRSGGEAGIGFAVSLRASLEGGDCEVLGETLIVRGAQKLTLVLASATTFRESDPASFALSATTSALNSGWSQLKAEHIAEYQKFFGRVRLKLGNEPKDELPTDQRLQAQAAGETDPSLAALYFQFGRYLLLCSSRDGSLPANLQGVWNQDFWPSWGSKYTININTEMNYWPAEVANLPECHEPLFVMLERLLETGRETARIMYDCDGFVVHHNTDIWADAAPTDRNLAASYWCLGGCLAFVAPVGALSLCSGSIFS